MFDLVKLVASNDTTTIITGESGTSKEVVARTIHALSNQREHPFVPINAAAIPEDLSVGAMF